MTTEPEAPVETPPAESTLTWEEIGVGDEIRGLLAAAGFTKPTPVQQKAIPEAMAGKDLIVSAQTGTGKTAAFVFPMIEKFKGRQGTYGLVLAPSREIALQTQAVLEQFGTPLGIRSICLIGGIDMKKDKAAFDTYPQVIVATPGRLVDHLERGNVWLEFVEIVVLDEADRMLDMGFTEQLTRVLSATPQDRQTLLFSATVPPPVEFLAKKILHDPVRIAIGKPTSAAKTVEQRFRFIDEAVKVRELRRLLQEEPGSIFIFCRSKDGASRLWRTLHSAGIYDATHLHSGLRQDHREKALEEFKSGKYRIMIATDVIGRGIHVDGVAHVVNYDLPMDASDYVHRIGRTGRAEASGRATTFVTPRDGYSLKGIEKILGHAIPPPPSFFEAGSSRPPGRGGHRRGNGRPSRR